MRQSTMTRLFAPAALALIVGMLPGFMLTCVAADETALSPALKALQGAWTTSENDNIEAKWTFDGEKVKTEINGVEYVSKVKLDDKAKPSATADFEVTDGPDEAKGKIAYAIYRLEGDKLTIAVSTPGQERPKSFESVPDEVHLFTMKKSKG